MKVRAFITNGPEQGGPAVRVEQRTETGELIGRAWFTVEGDRLKHDPLPSTLTAREARADARFAVMLARHFGRAHKQPILRARVAERRSVRFAWDDEMLTLAVED